MEQQLDRSYMQEKETIPSWDIREMTFQQIADELGSRPCYVALLYKEDIPHGEGDILSNMDVQSLKRMLTYALRYLNQSGVNE